MRAVHGELGAPWRGARQGVGVLSSLGCGGGGWTGSRKGVVYRWTEARVSFVLCHLRGPRDVGAVRRHLTSAPERQKRRRSKPLRFTFFFKKKNRASLWCSDLFMFIVHARDS